MATVLTQPIIPPPESGRNYVAGTSIQLSPSALPLVRFRDGAVRLRFYADTSLFRVQDLMGSQENVFHLAVHRHLPPTDFRSLYVIRHDTTLDYTEVYLDSVSTSSSFLLTATNILFGTLSPGDIPDTLKVHVLVPARKSLQLNPGIRLVTPNFASIIVRGTMSAVGTQEDSVLLGTPISIFGKADTSLRNNLRQLYCSFTSGSHLDVNYANAVVEQSRFIGVASQQFSSLRLTQSVITNVASCSYSYLMIGSCRFLPDAFMISNHSILKVENSLFENLTYESSHQYSLLHLKNNIIYADAFLEPIQPLRCFLLYEGNTLRFSGTSNSNRVGFSVYEGNYAIIRNNIVIGFRNAVEVGYDNKATVYNNTFVQSGGVALYGTVDSVSVYNNIFYAHGGLAINVNVSTGNREDNRVWVDSNAYFSGQYINSDTAGTGIVIGNTYSLNADPEFADTILYRLQATSPAIDRGARSIPSFRGTFSVIDTLFFLPASLLVTNYVGALPDIGAREYDPSVRVWNPMHLKVPSEFALNQNYPNPFNSSTIISFDIALRSHVSLKLFDLIGREITTIISEELPQGLHFRQWDATGLPSGVYFYRLQAGVFHETKKLILLR